MNDDHEDPDLPPISAVDPVHIGDIGAASLAGRHAVSNHLAQRAPDELRARLAPVVAEYAEALMADVRDARAPGHGIAMRLYAQIIKAVGASLELTVNVWQQMGAKDELHAKALMDRALEAENMDEDTAFRVSEAFVMDYRRRHGLPELVEVGHGEAEDRPGSGDGV